MKFINFASGSKGNCTLISNNNTHILIDCGIGVKKLKECLAKYDLNILDIKAIFLTHSHGDHVAGLSSVLNHHKIKVYGLTETLQSVIDMLEKKLGFIDTDIFYPIYVKNHQNDSDLINIDNDIKLLPCQSYHDVECVFYKIFISDLKLAILTDCGIYDDYIVRVLSDVNYMMLECNYDEDNLMAYENYPYYLKMRIKGKNGHLSKNDCASLIKDIYSPNIKKICLSHISEHTMKREDDNSEYQIVALDFVKNYLINHNIDISSFDLTAATQHKITEIINE